MIACWCDGALARWSVSASVRCWRVGCWRVHVLARWRRIWRIGMSACSCVCVSACRRVSTLASAFGSVAQLEGRDNLHVPGRNDQARHATCAGLRLRQLPADPSRSNCDSHALEAFAAGCVAVQFLPPTLHHLYWPLSRSQHCSEAS